MIDTHRGSSGTRLRRFGCVLAGTAAIFVSLGGAALADEVKFPEINPVVAMDVPHGWDVFVAPDGMDLKSPEKNAIIVADVVYREKGLVDAWAKMATGKLEAFGVVFDKNAKAPPKVAGAKPTPAPVANASAFTTDPDAFSFAGKPSLAMPGTTGSNDPVAPAETSIEALTHLGAPTLTESKSKLPFKAVQYYGTTLNGKPVDVQFVIYSLPDKRYFVMMQESGSDDGRTVAIAKSLRPVD